MRVATDFRELRYRILGMYPDIVQEYRMLISEDDLMTLWVFNKFKQYEYPVFIQPHPHTPDFYSRRNNLKRYMCSDHVANLFNTDHDFFRTEQHDNYLFPALQHVFYGFGWKSGERHEEFGIEVFGNYLFYYFYHRTERHHELFHPRVNARDILPVQHPPVLGYHKPTANERAEIAFR